MFPANIEGQCYVFVDTPGFNDSDEGRTDVDVFLEILNWFRAMSQYCDLTGPLCSRHHISPVFRLSQNESCFFPGTLREGILPKRNYRHNYVGNTYP